MNRPFRSELKYLVRHADQEVLLENWRRYLVKDPFTNEDAVTPVLSQYYDSPSLRFYEEKLDGLWFRNKVRLRVYANRFRGGAAAFLEIKQRLGDKVHKIRQRLENFLPSDLEPTNWRFSSPEQQSAFGVLLERHHLCPSAQVFYQREAYQGVVEPDVRVTFDRCLTGLFPGEVLTPGLLADSARALMPDTLSIMEVKVTGTVPSWVTDGAQMVELIQKPVPKYVLAVEKLRLQQMSLNWP